MKAYQIFQNLSAELAREVFHYLRTEQKEVYQSTVGSLAGQRKLRPVFIQRKPPEQQYVWLAKTTKLRSSDEICQHLLQLWLLKGHQAMLIEFLDGVGIEHDGEGAADDLPDDLDVKKLKTTVDKLLESNDAELLTAYLYTFQLQKDEGWQEIIDLVESDDRLGWAEEEEEEVAEAEVVAEPEPEPETEAEPETQPEIETEPEAGAETAAEPEAEQETEVEAEAEPEAEPELEQETEVEAAAEPERKTEAEPEANSDEDAEDSASDDGEEE